MALLAGACGKPDEAAKDEAPPPLHHEAPRVEAIPIPAAEPAEIVDRQSPSYRFKEAMEAHSRFSSCFKTKLRTGFCRFEDGPQQEVVRSIPAADLVRAASRRLAQLSNLQSSGAGRTAALVYHVADSGDLRVFLLDSYGIRAATEANWPVEGVLEGLRQTMRLETRAVRAPQQLDRGLEALPASPGPSTRDLAGVRDLLLPAAIADVIRTDAYDRLLILSWLDIGSVPFAALPMDGDKHLVDYVSTVVLPDVDTLIPAIIQYYDGDRMKPYVLTFKYRPENPVYAIGNPLPVEASGWQLPPLPGAEAEAQEVAQILNGEALVGSAATLSAVRRRIRTAFEKGGTLYLASHGIADGVNPMDQSFVALAGGNLTGRNVADLTSLFNDHPLVVMSACQTGLGKNFGGGTFGLARAWYHAGAGQVVGSLWNVDDSGTRELMTRFARHLAAGEFVETSLRKAMLETRGLHPDPAIWASFVVFGNPSGRDGLTAKDII